MGVHSLWDIVGPAARPVKLEALSRKRLAVDASIWIYQFMKAVRDKEGNSLGQTHIVGFFRRICKMLFFGILPLFVFDGGAPPLKRQVIQARKERRQGNQENAKSAAQKLLAMQMHRRTGEGQIATKGKHPPEPKDATALAAENDNLYFDDLPMYHTEKPTAPPPPLQAQTETFRRKDEYHLPDLKQFTVRKGDQRIMPEGELEDYGDEHSWDVVDGISIDSVDPSSSEFAELPMATQYMILSHLRLRSRLRLGYSKDQLEHLFPNSRDFSKFQIQQVQKRNYYTQKLMNVSGMAEDTGNVTRRIAGDKDRQYMLVKNEGGWTLSLGGDGKDEAIELDDDGEIERPRHAIEIKDEHVADESDDDDLEDVPLGDESNTAHTAARTSAPQSEDEDMGKAVIESIYERYKHEYDDIPSVQQNDQEIPEQIKTLGDTDLKMAIEESKIDYFQQKSKEDQLSRVIESTGQPGFDFGKSLLFGESQSQVAHLIEGPLDKGNGKERVTVNVDNHVESPKNSEEEEDAEEDKQVKSMPLWFNDSSHLQSPHAQIGFLTEREQSRQLDDDEKAGLIPWNEAKRYFEEVAEEASPSDDDVDKMSEEGDDSDLEIVEKATTASDLERSDDHEEEEIAVQNMVPSSNSGPQKSRKGHHSRKRVDPRKVFVQRSKRSSRKASKKPLATTQRSRSRSPQGDHSVTSVDSSASKPIVNNEDTNEGTNKSTKKAKNSAILDYDFDESEEEDLVRQLREEEHEHAQFTSSIQFDKIPIHTTVSNEQLLQEQLNKAKRDAEEVTQTMINDVQELLKRFGIPYITAPMEAEAQCAELYRLELVDGIVTDDSDCFLFGGSRIYKNMFNQNKYVECYISEDIEHKVGLNQKKLIELALVLGSDYTEGIKGIGPVLAMEILAEFGSLEAFKLWFDETTKTLKKRDPKQTSKLEKTLLARIKNGKLFLPDTFPDQIVVDAYKRPEVDHDRSEFKWGVPLLDQIRSFLMYNVGWSQERVDEVMVPLIRNINKTRTEGQQTTIGEFFPQEYISYKKDVGMGKRMKAAAERIRGD